MKTFQAYWFFLCGLVSLGTIIIFPFIEIIFEKLVKGKITFDYELFSILMITSLIITFGSVFLYFLRSINKVSVVLTITIFKTIIFYSVLALSKKTLVNFALGFLLSNIFIYLIYLNYITYKSLSKINVEMYFKRVIFSFFPVIYTVVYIVLWEQFHSIEFTLISFLFLLIIFIFYGIKANIFNYLRKIK